MRQIADDVYQLKGFPPNAINVYLAGDVLIDAATPMAAKRILRQLEHHDVNAHALTHAHPDHFGSSAAVCDTLGIPLWCPAADAETVETGVVPRGPHQPAFLGKLKPPPTRTVDRRLVEGDEVAGFQVLDVPGHSIGHVAFWRESDRTLIAGDVFFNIPRLRQPPKMLTRDPERNREAMRRLAELEPALACFGHGPPVRDPAQLKRAAA